MPSLVILFSAVLVYHVDRQNHRITKSYTDVDDPYTHATPVSVSNKLFSSWSDVSVNRWVLSMVTHLS